MVHILSRRHAENPIKRVTPGISVKKRADGGRKWKKKTKKNIDIQRTVGEIEVRRRGRN